MVTQDGSPSLGWPPHTGYTSNRACCYSGVCHNLVSGAGWWPRPLPSSVCLTASDTLRSMAMATTRRRTNTFSGFNEAARWVGHWGPAIGRTNHSMPIGPWAQTKAMWPVLHNVHFWFVRASARNALQLADSQPEANRQRRDEIPSINALSAAPQALTRSALVPLAVLRAWAPPSRREGGGGEEEVGPFCQQHSLRTCHGPETGEASGFRDLVFERHTTQTDGEARPGRQVPAGSPSLKAVPEKCTSPCPNLGTRAVHRRL